VNAEGKSFPISEGALRASHRKLSSPDWEIRGLPHHSFTREDQLPLKDGEVASLDFYLQPLAYTIHPGERLRVVLMGSDMKNFDVLVPEKAPRIRLYGLKNDPSYISLPMSQKEEPS